MDLYSAIIEELRLRGIAFVRKLAPPYIASIGAHVFNLHNKRFGVYWELGRIPDMRVHLMTVAPPGFSKTLLIEEFLRGQQALLWESGIDIGYEQIMTEAGFVGTVKLVEGEVIVKEGSAYEYKEAIVGCEEFSALSAMMKAQHSKALDNAILTALDTGFVTKKLAAGRIQYQTFLTLWAATQPMRFDLTSGLARRFVFVVFVPGAREREVIRKARRKARGRRYDVRRTEAIRAGLRRFVDEVKAVKDVEWPEEMYKLLDQYMVPHYEEMLYERVALGFELMRRGARKVVKVLWEPELEAILKDMISWRLQAKFGTQYAQILLIVQECGGSVGLERLYRELSYYGLDLRTADELLTDLRKMGMITLRSREVMLRVNPFGGEAR